MVTVEVEPEDIELLLTVYKLVFHIPSLWVEAVQEAQ